MVAEFLEIALHSIDIGICEPIGKATIRLFKRNWMKEENKEHASQIELTKKAQIANTIVGILIIIVLLTSSYILLY
jgi:hypothetical protein